MSLKVYLITAAVGIVCSGVFTLIDVKISAGILLSTLFSLLNMVLLSASMKFAIQGKEGAYGIMMMSNIVRYSLLILCMFIAYKLPQYFSLIGVAIGMSLFLIALIIDAIEKRRKG
ncbi:MAG: ATP synthase subunit I [Erysipelotrichaceae bacterium]|nr:ATP synthase subunit I [Erysipelotrichaceae bacterium]